MATKNGDLPAMPLMLTSEMVALIKSNPTQAGIASGISKREQFAAMAMQGLLVKVDVNINNVARLAVDVADRLLGELEKLK